jgi:hypothetical protein
MACLYRGEGIIRIVMLDEVVANPGLVTPSEYGREVDLSGSDIDHGAIRGHVFDMDQWESAGILSKIFEGVSTAFENPKEVHLELHEWIGMRQHDVEGNLALDQREFEVVIVISKRDAGRMRMLGRDVEAIGHPSKIIETFPTIGVNVCHDDVLVPDGRGIVHDHLPLILHLLDANV